MSDNLFGSWVAGGNSTKGREKDDFYPTPDECVLSLINNVAIPQSIWEPACGDGAISKILEQNGHDVYSTDLVYRGYGTGGIDFLQEKEARAPYVITNPPFKLAEKFIIKCHELDLDGFAFILKSQYWHAAKRIKLFNEIRPSKVMPMTWRPDFTGGGSPTMDCIWCVWERGNKTTEYMPIGKVKK